MYLDCAGMAKPCCGDAGIRRWHVCTASYRQFAGLTEKWIRWGTHRSTQALEQAITYWLESWNDNLRPFVWVKTADQILETMAALCQRTSNSRH